MSKITEIIVNHGKNAINFELENVQIARLILQEKINIQYTSKRY